ncbi:MAG: exodeoxyribonuclease III [Rhodospirillaceae bacterium]
MTGQTQAFSIASWNVNSLRRRLDALGWFADEVGPDVICLQETKVVDALFPADAVAALGYPHQAFAGIKGYNGVAILSRRPLGAVEVRPWCGRDDARHIQASVDTGTALGTLEVHSVYVPAGGEKPDPLTNAKFAHKLAFLTELAHWWAARGDGPNRVMAGDFNIAPLVADVWSHERLRNTVTHTEIEIVHLDALRRAARWVDAVRLLHADDVPVFTWWSYRSADWEAANKGRRLDHIWISENLAERAAAASVFTDARDWDPPSDHAPVILTLNG